jgi:hypothetical protein
MSMMIIAIGRLLIVKHKSCRGNINKFSLSLSLPLHTSHGGVKRYSADKSP